VSTEPGPDGRSSELDWALPRVGGGARLRALGSTLGRRLRASPYIVRWLVLGALVGAAAGLVVVAFARAIQFSDHQLLQRLAGYVAPTVFASGQHPGSLAVARPWALPLVVGIGGVLAGLVALVVPESAGSGTDEAVRAVHGNPRSLRLRSIPGKIVASAFTIGSGGSAGPEGPSAQVAAAVGSALGRVLDLPLPDGRVAVAIGIGSGIGCVFRAPLGGALLSAEILYRQDSEVEVIIPSAIASIVAYTVFSVFQGFSPLMGFAGESYVFSHPIRLVWFLIIGVIAAFVGMLYAKSMTWARAAASRLGTSRWATVARPALGGVVVGSLAVGVPGVLGTGDGWAQRALLPALVALPLWFVLVMPVAKLGATALTVGTGGSGGLFSPGMVIGAFLGAATWRLMRPVFPSVPHDPASFVIIGMMCCLGSIARTPLAVTVMVAEMTSSIGVVAPALLAVGVATLIVGQTDLTLIEAQLRTRDDAPARRLVLGMPMLSAIKVAEVMQSPRSILPAAGDAGDAAAHLGGLHLPGAPVADETGRFVGVVTTAALERAADAEVEIPVGRLADRQAPTLSPDAPLSEAVASLLASERGWATVLDDARRVVGIVTNADLVTGYRRLLGTSMRRVTQSGTGAGLVEERIGETSPVAHRHLAEAGLPAGSVVVTVARGDELILPDAQTVLEPGDVVGALVPERNRERLLTLLAPPSEDGEGGDEGDDGEDAGPKQAHPEAADPTEPGS